MQKSKYYQTYQACAPPEDSGMKAQGRDAVV